MPMGKRKVRQLKALQSIGFLDSNFIKLRRYENQAHKLAEDICNAAMEEEEIERRENNIINALKGMFKDEKLPEGFFINFDPRGYALKIKENQVPEGLETDWGGYGILCPEF